MYSYVDLPDVNLDNAERYIELAKSIFPKNNIKHKRVTIPSGLNQEDLESWEYEEVRRCVEGHNGMCGTMYFYFNYCKIQSPEEGTIRPEFRVCDNEYFKVVESCGARLMKKGEIAPNKGKGLVVVKRRRQGASWMASCIALHNIMFRSGTVVGLNSKTEKDSRSLFRKIKFIYDNLPDFLREPAGGGKSRDSLILGYKTKDSKGNEVFRGSNSQAFCVPPVETAFEGNMMNVWLCDEAGKIDVMEELWTLTLPCLENNLDRVGVPIVFGTAGDISKGSRGLMDLWYNSNTHDMIKFFFAGWMGTNVDEYGNDDIEGQVYKILKTRKAYSDAGSSKLKTYIQQYPLTAREALTNTKTTGIGNQRNIEEQIRSLGDNPHKATRGLFTYTTSSSGKIQVDFLPNPNGSSVIYEYPQKHISNLYSSGCDPIDHDNTSKRSSNQALYIVKKSVGASPPKLVFSYVDQTKKVEDYWEQAALALLFYNETKVLIENNRTGMIKHFETLGLHRLLKTEPVKIENIKKKFVPKIGWRKSTASTIEMERCINEFTENYCDQIPDLPLLHEFSNYGGENTDRVIAFGLTCISLLDESRNKPVEMDLKGESKLLKTKLQRIGGKIVRTKR